MSTSPLADFTPTKEVISLHGLGFIQVVLGGGQRMHVWHPALPRRKCFEHSAVHNHRFSFRSLVLKGRQINQRCDVEVVKPGTGSHMLISHNGPRSDKGSRESFPVADVNLHMREPEVFLPGQEYTMAQFEYHHTANVGIVITVLQKLEEGTIHANSTCRRGIDFDYGFDRFQLSPSELFNVVVTALGAL